MRKVLFLLLVAMPVFCFKAMAQNGQLLTLDDSLKVQKKAYTTVDNFLSSHSLASLRDSKQLKSVENETICFPPAKYCRYIGLPRLISGSSAGRKLGLITVGAVATMLGANPSQLNYGDGDYLNVSDNSSWDTSDSDDDNWSDSITMVVKKAKSSKLTVIYQNKEYKIDARDRGLENMILLKDRDDLLQQINQLYVQEEQEVLQERQQNLAIYRESIEKFHNGSTGPIKVNTGGRKYDGSIPFSQSGDGRNLTGADTYLDETFVFNKKIIEKKIEWLKEKKANDLRRQRDFDITLREIEEMRNDTLGLFLNKGRNTYDDSHDEILFINLRTGQVLRNDHLGWSFSRDLLESTTYLNNYAKVAPFNYDGTWSLQNLLYGYCPNTKYPQAVYEALGGEKVYVLKKDDYEEDEIVEVIIGYDDKPRIETKKNGLVEIDRIVGARWFQKLQAMVGKKVIMRTDDGMFYKEDLPKMTVWTIDGIEAKKYNRSGNDRLELDMHLSSGDQKKTIDVLEDCSLLTRSLDLSRPVNGNGLTALSYDYLMANAPKMPAEVKREREAKDRFFNVLGNAIKREIKNYDPVKQMKKQAKETHVYECQHCRARLKATGKGNFFQSGKCLSGFPHAWEKID